MNYFAPITKSVHSTRLIILLCITSVSAVAQIGGKNSFNFLNVAPSARLSALGGINVSLADRDINFFINNPSLAGDTLNGVASISYQFYVADIGQASFVYAQDFKKIGAVIFGLQHIGYGDIQGYDPTGAETSLFNSGETAFIIGKQHQLGNFRMGIALKAAASNIAGYRSTVLMADVGGVYIHPQKPFTVGLVIKNVGFVLNDYRAGSDSKLPFDVQLGATLKPEHMPLRFSLTAYNLTQPDVTYADPGVDDSEPGTLSKVLAHVNLGAEVLLHRGVTLMLGYNYLTHQALKLAGGGGGAGISLGFSANVKSFEFVFSRAAYVAGSAGYSFTLSTNVNKLLKRQSRV